MVLKQETVDRYAAQFQTGYAVCPRLTDASGNHLTIEGGRPWQHGFGLSSRSLR